jgi:hypothetical protein
MKRQFAVVSMLFLLACQDSGTGPIPQGQPSNAIIDGRHGGNSHFFWLNPQSALPPTAKFAGTPNAELAPVVRICRWSGSSCVGNDVAVLAIADGTLKAKPLYYEGLWKAFQAAPLQNEVFRARVYLGNLEIGARDMKFLSRTDFGKFSADHPDFAPVLWYANAYIGPNAFGVHTITFRMEDGVLREALGLGDEECTDCSEGSVSPGETETVVIETPSEDAAAVFAPGSVSQPINVLVEKLDVPCLPTDAQQYPACYRFVAEPDIEFTIPATVEVCIERIDNFAEDQVQLYKVKERRVEGEWVPTGPVEALENVPDRFINCGEPEVIGAIGRKYPQLARGLRSLTRPLAKVLGPRAAWATDEGRGGRASEFSRVGWARAVNITKGSGDNQAGAAGATLSPVEVHLTPVHFDHHSEDTPVAAGVPVRFQLIGPGTTAGPIITAFSNSDGVVSIPVTLGAAAGAYRLVVTAPGTNLADRNAETGELSPRAVPVAEFTLTALNGDAELVNLNDTNILLRGTSGAGNNAFVSNLVNFSGTGPRSTATRVVMDFGRNSPETPATYSALTAAIQGLGFTVEHVATSTGSVLTIPADVKVIFLFLPEVTFTVEEVNLLKVFASEGGRIVLVGEYNQYIGVDRAAVRIGVHNQLLADLGSGARNIGGAFDCGLNTATADQIGSHQLTTGVTSLQFGCGSAMSLTLGDTPLLVDDGSTANDLATLGCAGSCPIAATARISTAPITSHAPTGVLVARAAVQLNVSSGQTGDSFGNRK